MGHSTAGGRSLHAAPCGDNAGRRARRVICYGRATMEFAGYRDHVPICVKITVDRGSRSAIVDLTGSSAQLDTNFNAPPAVVHAAVLYVFRTLVEADIPMTAGCLRPITVVIPEGVDALAEVAGGDRRRQRGDFSVRRRSGARTPRLPRRGP